MRKELESLQQKIDWINSDNIYSAVSEIREILSAIVKNLDQALPIDKSGDV